MKFETLITFESKSYTKERHKALFWFVESYVIDKKYMGCMFAVYGGSSLFYDRRIKLVWN